MIEVRMTSLLVGGDKYPRLCCPQFDVLASASGIKDKPDSSLPYVSTWTRKSFPFDCCEQVAFVILTHVMRHTSNSPGIWQPHSHRLLSGSFFDFCDGTSLHLQSHPTLGTFGSWRSTRPTIPPRYAALPASPSYLLPQSPTQMQT